MFKKKKISFRETLLTKKKPDLLHKIYYEMVSNSIFYTNKVFLKYATLGIVGTLADLILFMILVYSPLRMNYIIAAIIGSIAGFSINYLLNSRYIVKERDYKQSKVNFWYTFFYFSVSVLCFILTIVFMIILVEKFVFSYLFANYLSSFVFFLIKFLMHRLLFNRYGH